MDAIVRRICFPLFFAGAIVVGTLLRLSGPTKARRDPAGIAVDQSPGGLREEEDSRRAQQVVLDFYRLMEQAEFRRAAEIVVELLWKHTEDGDPIAIGVKDREQFIAHSEHELRDLGTSYAVLDLVAEPDEIPSGDREPAELAALLSLPEGRVVSDVASVKVQGTAQIECSVFDWERRVVVVKMDDAWRVLLPPPAADGSRLHSWFFPSDETDFRENRR